MESERIQGQSASERRASRSSDHDQDQVFANIATTTVSPVVLGNDDHDDSNLEARIVRTIKRKTRARTDNVTRSLIRYNVGFPFGALKPKKVLEESENLKVVVQSYEEELEASNFHH